MFMLPNVALQTLLFCFYNHNGRFTALLFHGPFTTVAFTPQPTDGAKIMFARLLITDRQPITANISKRPLMYRRFTFGHAKAARGNKILLHVSSD